MLTSDQIHLALRMTAEPLPIVHDVIDGRPVVVFQNLDCGPSHMSIVNNADADAGVTSVTYMTARSNLVSTVSAVDAGCVDAACKAAVAYLVRTKEDMEIPVDIVELTKRRLLLAYTFIKLRKKIVLLEHQLVEAAIFHIRFLLYETHAVQDGQPMMPNPSAVYADDCGSGKTFTLITVILLMQLHRANCEDCRNGTCQADNKGSGKKRSIVCDNLDNAKVLLAVPPALQDQWLKWLDKFNVHTLKSDNASFANARRTMTNQGHNYTVYCVTLSQMGLAKKTEMHLDLVKTFNPEIMIVDEAHNAKNVTNNTTSILRNIHSYDGVNLKQTILVTATPVTNKLSEISTQLCTANIINAGMKDVVHDVVTQNWIYSYIVKCDQSKSVTYEKEVIIHEVDLDDETLDEINEINNKKMPYFTKVADVNSLLVKPQTKEIINILAADKNTENIWIVFTHYLEIQDDLAETLTGLGYHALVLNGSMSPSARGGVLDGLRNDSLRGQRKIAKETVIIASIGCMGEGCDIQFANRTILVWPGKTPSQELQAMGRIDRPGQKSDKIVHHFIMCNTGTEERLLELNKDKIKDMLKIPGSRERMDKQYLENRYDFDDNAVSVSVSVSDENDMWRDAVLKTLNAVERMDNQGRSPSSQKRKAAAEGEGETEYEIMFKESKKEFESFMRTSSCSSCSCVSCSLSRS